MDVADGAGTMRATVTAHRACWWLPHIAVVLTR